MELPRNEKSKFECEVKKFNLLVKGAFSSQKRPQTSLFSNKLNFFSSHSNFDFFFLREETQDDHIRSQYEFGTDKKNLGVLGVADMRQLLLKFIVASFINPN